MNVYDFIRVVNFPVKLALGIGIKLGFEPGEDGDETKTLIVVNWQKWRPIPEYLMIRKR